MHRDMRSSDRWITPGVVGVGIVVAGVVVLGVAGLVAYLTARGIDPDPVLRLAAQVATGVGALGSLLLQLVGRRTIARTERNTGLLTEAVYEVADNMPRPRPAATDTAHMLARPPAPGGE